MIRRGKYYVNAYLIICLTIRSWETASCLECSSGNGVDWMCYVLFIPLVGMLLMWLAVRNLPACFLIVGIHDSCIHASNHRLTFWKGMGGYELLVSQKNFLCSFFTFSHFTSINFLMVVHLLLIDILQLTVTWLKIFYTGWNGISEQRDTKPDWLMFYCLDSCLYSLALQCSCTMWPLTANGLSNYNLFILIPSITVVAGDHTRNITEGFEQTRQSAQIFVHPSWNPNSIDADIALIKLSHPVIFNSHVQPACLPRQDEYLWPGKRCFITGEL